MESGPADSRALPEIEAFESHGWRFTAVRHKAILPSTCVCGQKQPFCLFCQYEQQLRIAVLPEMVFFKNSLQMEHQSGARIEFNSLDALREVSEKATTGYCVAATDVWTKARSECLADKKVANNYDWTFSSSYKGTYRHLTTSATGECIDYNALRIREPIEFYQSFPLYEDELSDHGCSMMDLKFRCMPSGFFLLLRLYLRIDKVVVRMPECRLHWRFASNYGLRECTLKEKSFCDLNETERAAVMNVDEISNLLEPVVLSRERVDFCDI
uniref:TIP41-like protein n=1 Tax=Trichuris muris TaxID=70415 RepID=A0A5S6R3G5_TRIMR